MKNHVKVNTEVYTTEFSMNAVSRVRKIERSTAGCRDLPSERAWDEIQELNLYLNNSNSYYPFRVTNWSDNEKCKMSSYFTSIRDESRYQAADSSGTYKHCGHGLNEDAGFELRQAVRIAQMADNNFNDGVPYRQTFDSISKDF